MAYLRMRRRTDRQCPTLLFTTAAAFAVLLLTGCGGGGGGTAIVASGVSGLAQISRTGGAIFPGKPPQPPVPLPQATLSVQPDGGGREIARTTADANGRFRFDLSPGRYLIVPVLSQSDQISGVSAASQSAVVGTGVYTDLVVNYSQNLP